MQYIFIAVAAVGVVGLVLGIHDLFFAPELPDFEQDMFSTLPWGEIIEGKV